LYHEAVGRASYLPLYLQDGLVATGDIYQCSRVLFARLRNPAGPQIAHPGLRGAEGSERAGDRVLCGRTKTAQRGAPAPPAQVMNRGCDGRGASLEHDRTGDRQGSAALGPRFASVRQRGFGLHPLDGHALLLAHHLWQPG
jgi:hypothetical protein